MAGITSDLDKKSEDLLRGGLRTITAGTTLMVHTVVVVAVKRDHV